MYLSLSNSRCTSRNTAKDEQKYQPTFLCVFLGSGLKSCKTSDEKNLNGHISAVGFITFHCLILYSPGEFYPTIQCYPILKCLKHDNVFKYDLFGGFESPLPLKWYMYPPTSYPLSKSSSSGKSCKFLLLEEL